MKGFLFDSNLPTRLTFTPSLPVTFAASFGRSPTDTTIWDYAHAHDLAIVSKDADFSVRIVATAPPPRVVHLRIGNMRRRHLHAFLARVWPRIEYLAASHKLVNVYIDRIEAIN